ncbi:MAG: M28 family peptidase [Saprospiraceae bacterium]|nr:M28 family peptidase [Saprospiraceae bacterium]HMW39578.1 M28 family peptidase [Saprospiraceae bacterium]HMX86868.1 M28 family peptidase [Saprospiraceae bacterium]HMZ39024.1 M28 family peptidase [Saprospiraceae bacterium]HNB29896.1 M28 family peptidase [Saprospiraceae bacterium]
MCVKLVLFLFWSSAIFSQTNFSFSNPEFEDFLKGNFQNDHFEKRLIQSDEMLPAWLKQQISPDSLSVFLHKIISFRNRNTIADTVTEPDKGIRGARKMISKYLQYLNERNFSVIEQSEFSFDYEMCGRLRHTELMSFVPGVGPQKNELVIVEAHLDSRCEDRCDNSCVAEGAEDNGSGSAMMMELARLLSQVELKRSIVIIWITGEEQGLGGSRSFAVYCKNNGIKIKAVFNNDIVGGIECGITSSPPSCPGPIHYDSTHLRIFSSGTVNSMHKNLARLSKVLMENNKNISSPIQLDVMINEDRTGRGSDHIPFRENGFTALRYTSSYEHGDGNPDQPNYQDRQHSVRDVLGRDIDNDGVLDSLFVNFAYLANNTFVNAVTASNAATNFNVIPQIKATVNGTLLTIDITNPDTTAREYLYLIRRITSVYYDTIIRSSSTHLELGGLSGFQYYVSALAVGDDQWMSMISNEVLVRIVNAVKDLNSPDRAVELIQNKPNPFDEYTIIPVIVNDRSKIRSAALIITDDSGTQIQHRNLDLIEGVNEIFFELPYGALSETYYYSLVVNGDILQTLKMQVLNW